MAHAEVAGSAGSAGCVAAAPALAHSVRQRHVVVREPLAHDHRVPTEPILQIHTCRGFSANTISKRAVCVKNSLPHLGTVCFSFQDASMVWPRIPHSSMSRWSRHDTLSRSIGETGGVGAVSTAWVCLKWAMRT